MPVRYSINEITPDMVLGEAVMLPTGKMLLNSGYTLTERYKERLAELGYKSLLVAEPGTEEAIPGTTISGQLTAELDTTMNESGKGIAALMNHFRDQASQDIHKLLFEKRNDLNQFIMNAAMVRQVESIVNELMNEPDMILNLAALRNSEHDYFTDAINITITSICLARKFNLPIEDIRNLATGAINYHVGMLVLPEEILKSKVSLTNEQRDIYRNHTVYGYLMLSQNKRISPTSAIVSLQHHENQNGSGYPLKLTGSNRQPFKDISQQHVIHRFAEIVSVADKYSTFLKAGGGATPDVLQDALQKMIKLSGEVLNREIVKMLTTIVPVLPVGTRVRITRSPDPMLTRYIGVVSKDNPRNISRPEIILFQTFAHTRLEHPIKLDLSKLEGVEVEALI